MSEKKAIEALQDLGLTEYEARVYTTLVKIKSGIVSEIHVMSGIPRSAVYGALKKLENKGIVEVQYTKPMKYKVLSPSKTLDKFRNSFLLETKKALNALDDIYNVDVKDNQIADTMWINQGGLSVHDKIFELIMSANEEIVITAYSVLFNLRKMHHQFQDIVPALNEAMKRGADLKVICKNEEEYRQVFNELPGSQIKISSWENPEGSLLLVDKKYSLIVVCSGTDLKMASAISTEGSSIVSMFHHFVENLWQTEADDCMTRVNLQ